MHTPPFDIGQTVASGGRRPMHGREKRVLLREYLNQGWSKTALADKLGISRRTIHQWIRTGQLDRDLDDEAVRYRVRPEVSHKLDAYHPIIQSRIEQFPMLSSVRLLEEIRSAGYTGGYTQLKEYVRQIRPVEVEPPVRFETPPRVQAQVDFAEFHLPWGKRWALVVVLAYSRLMWLRFFRRQTAEALFRGLEQAFGYFGGVTAEVLFDQMRAVIIGDERLKGGALLENLEFLRFSNHWGFRVRACRPYRAKTKGKVERPIRYVRENFFYGRTFVSDEDLDSQLYRWLEQVANCRIHGTTDERPVERFARDEVATLRPLAGRPYHSLLLPAGPAGSLGTSSPGHVDVERRPLGAYRQLAEVRR
jgi:transposase